MTLVFQVRMSRRLWHPPICIFHPYPIWTGGCQPRKQRWFCGRPSDPGPQDLTDNTKSQMLPTLHEIDNRPVVPVVFHGEEDIMPIAVALHHNLVAVVAQHCAPPPAFVPVDLIAQTHRKLAEIDFAFEIVEFAIQVHHRNPFLPYCPLSFRGWF